ncbi:MAG: TRAP transporter substrate-binding protein [Acidobacteriota bacterium]
MPKLSSLFLGIALSAACAAAGAQSWDLPSAYAPANFHSVNLEKFADGVKSATGGKLQIKVHPGASLYKATEIKRAVQTGQAPIGEILMVLLVNENPLYAVDGLPFVAASYDAARRLSDVQRPYIEKILDAQGLKLLYSVPWPPQGLYAPKEINSVADLAGLNFRAYDKQTSRIGEIVKARPVTIQAAEVAQALAMGKINSLISSAQSGVDYKAWESVKFFHDVQAWLPKNMVFANKAAFNALDSAAQKALLAEAKKAEDAGWAASKATAEATKKTLANNGMRVLQPSPVLVGELNRIGQQMLDEWLATAGAEGKAVIDAFRK